MMTNQPLVERIVLYADDDPDDLEYVRDAFNDVAADITLLTFTSAIELLDHIQNKLSRNLPCLIMLDINMPKMNGKDALRIIRNFRHYEQIPVVLFTTSTSPHDARFASLYNASFISKPLHAKQMAWIVNLLLSRCTGSLQGTN